MLGLTFPNGPASAVQTVANPTRSHEA